MSSGLPNILSERDALELDQMMEEAKAQKVKSPSRNSPPVQPASSRKSPGKSIEKDIFSYIKTYIRQGFENKTPLTKKGPLKALKEQFGEEKINTLRDKIIEFTKQEFIKQREPIKKEIIEAIRTKRREIFDNNKTPNQGDILKEIVKNDGAPFNPYFKLNFFDDDVLNKLYERAKKVPRKTSAPRRPQQQRSKPAAKRPRSSKPYVPKKECRSDEFRNFDSHRCVQFKSDLAFKLYKLYHHWTDPDEPLYGRNDRERDQFKALVTKYSDQEFKENIIKFFSTDTGKNYLKEIENNHKIKKVEKKKEEKERKATTPCPVYIRNKHTGRCHALTKPLLKQIHDFQDVHDKYYLNDSVKQCKALIDNEQANIQKAQQPKPKPKLIPRKTIENQPRKQPEQRKKVKKSFEPPRFGYGV